ncbi:hypothetical protein V2J09_009588, partial [Rumex salicifolius]
RSDHLQTKTTAFRLSTLGHTTFLSQLAFRLDADEAIVRSPAIQMSGGSCRRGGAAGGGGWLRCCLVTFAVVSALCVCGPALFWKLRRSSSSSFLFHSSSSSSCAPCNCDCPPSLSLARVVPGLANLSIADCGSSDPDLKKEMEKEFSDLLTEELKLQEAVAAELAQHMNGTFTEARRIALLYQMEAEKCNAATETCEQARERSVALLTKEKRITSLWERRARKLGWEGL